VKHTRYPRTVPAAVPATFLVTAALALAACSGGDDTAATTVAAVAVTTSAPATTDTPTTVRATTTTTSTTEAPATTAPDVLRMPLTGEPIEDASEIPDRPALAVKIPTNPPVARPQAGLNKADIVFETVINGGFTRLIAMFHSDGTGENPLGPIRSGRGQDVNILSMFNRPLMAWSGGNPTVTSQFAGADAAGTLFNLNYVRGFSDLYYRRSGRGGSPHNLFSSTDTLWSAAPDDAEPPYQVFPYVAPGEQIDGVDATTIELDFDQIQVRWEYDPESKTYKRWQDESEHSTEEAGQVEAYNVVVMLMDYGVSRFDGNPEMQAFGANPVYVFSEGTVREGVWLRFTHEDGYTFYDNVDDLNELGLVPGRTWVEMPENQSGRVSIDGSQVTLPGTTVPEG
jgi:hypothetical protein